MLSTCAEGVQFYYPSHTYPAIPYYSPGNVPTFSLLGDRLDDGQPPQVSITFPDGYTDTIVLNHYFSEKDQIENGNYLGHLANEKEACVAMTGRIGSEDVEFTILSNHAAESNMFKWKKNGTVENIEHGFKVDACISQKSLVAVGSGL